MSRFVNPAKFGRIDPAQWREFPDHYTQPLWPAELPSSPSDYGTFDFHGRTHPEIIKVALMRYTQPGDVVWDPMAGGGTTIDVCKELDVSCIASDLNPVRKDIKQANARSWRPDDSCIDLVVLHPPYMGIVNYPGEGTLATNDIWEYKLGMNEVIQNVTCALKLNHVLVLIVGQLYSDQNTYMLDCELYPLLHNYRVLGRVVRPFGETKGGATAGKKNENLWKFRRLQWGIWGLGVDTVLFLQKVREPSLV